MSTSAQPPPVQIQPYERSDEAAVAELLGVVLPSWRVPYAQAMLRWKHERSPFGPSRAAVAVHAGDVVGFYASMPWRLVLDGRRLTASRVADGAVHPSMQRRGIGSSFGDIETQAAERREQDIHFNHGNATSELIKRKHHYQAGQHPPLHRAPIRPLHLLRRRRGHAGPVLLHRPLPALSELLDAEAEAVATLLELAQPPGRIVTDRSVPYLRWRYLEIPGRRYEVVTCRGRGGRLRGVLIGRHVPAPDGDRTGHPGSFEVSEIIAEGGEPAVARRLLRRVYRTRDPYAEALLPATFGRLDRLVAGFPIVTDRTWHFSVRGLAEGLPDDVQDWRRWDLALGDLATF